MAYMDPKNELIAELDREIQWEWHWEKHNRVFCLIINWAIWFARFLLLALATYQINIAKDALSLSWIVLSIAALSMLNVALPLLFAIFKFQGRQEAHDRNAREYGVIRTKLSLNKITLDEAINQFEKIRTRPIETKILLTF